MKLGSLLSNIKADGELVVVSKDNKTAASASQIAPHMQDALERWDEVRGPLEELYASLNDGSAANSFAVDQKKFHSPLPRAYQFADGSAFIHHIKLVRKARNAPLPDGLDTVPLMYQGLSDAYLAPYEDIPQVDFSHGTDFEGEVGVITSFVPMGTKAADAEQYIRLFVSINDISLRRLIPGELKAGFGFFQGKPASSFGPFAITVEELGSAWKDGRIHLPLDVKYNGEFFGKANAGQMHFSFGQLIEHAAKTRNLCAGTIVGSGTVSNEDQSVGSSCLVEKRMLEKIHGGEFVTPFMKTGDTVQIEMKNEQGTSLFGLIDQKVSQA